jgi:hypothetical protein
VVSHKYIVPEYIEEWIRLPTKNQQNGIIVWNTTIKVFSLVGISLVWEVGDGFNIRLGKYPWVMSFLTIS